MTHRRTLRSRGLRGRIGWHLRVLADRLDPMMAPRGMHWSFTFEPGEGIRFRDDGKGCDLWYLGELNYVRAHSEADTPAPEDMELSLGRPPT